jgi:hypothetical protein
MAGILQRGPRGLDLRPLPTLDEDVGNMHQYGIDWAVHRDPRLMRHLQTHNSIDQDAAESFRLPEHMARVECEPPNCPFTPLQMSRLRVELSDRVGEQVHRRDMPSRRVVWCHAYAIASAIRLGR